METGSPAIVVRPRQQQRRSEQLVEKPRLKLLKNNELPFYILPCRSCWRGRTTTARKIERLKKAVG